MKFYKLKPEVAGGLGDNSILDSSVHPPIVKKLNYHFDGWLGDDLLTTFPCFIITEKLRLELEKLSATGCRYDDVEVTTSEQFADLYPDRILPKFYWLKILGRAGIDDFGTTGVNRLVVSQRVLELLKTLNLQYCEIEDF